VLSAKANVMAQRSKSQKMKKGLAALSVGKSMMKTGFSARRANIGHVKTGGC
jgi:hypothetical protein